jgi:hypothetical protein
MTPATFSFATSPAQQGEQRKFVNPTRGFVGANVFAPDGKPTSIAVEPGGEIWLTEAEERMTAEAPRLASDNPFIKQWDEVIELGADGLPSQTVARVGTLVLAEEPPRPTASSRFIPARQVTEPEEITAADKSETPGEPPAPPAPEPEREVVGTELPAQPPTTGTPSREEIVGSPEAEPSGSVAAREGDPEAETPLSTGDLPDSDDDPDPLTDAADAGPLPI